MYHQAKELVPLKKKKSYWTCVHMNTHRKTIVFSSIIRRSIDYLAPHPWTSNAIFEQCCNRLKRSRIFELYEVAEVISNLLHIVMWTTKCSLEEGKKKTKSSPMVTDYVRNMVVTGTWRNRRGSGIGQSSELLQFTAAKTYISHLHLQLFISQLCPSAIHKIWIQKSIQVTS